MNTRASMKTFSGFVVALLLAALPAAAFAAAPPELNGIWQGRLAIDASTSLTVQFTFTKAANGSYTAVVNSPDNAAVKNAAVSGISWDGSSLKLQVPSLSGSYAGTLKNGKLNGQWSQPGGALPLELAPWQKPVLAASTLKALVGPWNGTITIARGAQNVVFQFKESAGGLEGTFSIPDQGVANIPMANVSFENGELSLKIQQAGIDFKGKLAGNQIAGTIKSPSPAIPPEGLPLNLQRGDYKPKAAPLKLTAESFAALKGKWQGTIEMTNPQNGQKASLPIIVRFETNDKSEFLGFLDSPAQNAKGVVVSEATLTVDKLVAKIATVGGEFSGTLAGNTLTGEWSQAAAGLRVPLTLTR